MPDLDLTHPAETPRPAKKTAAKKRAPVKRAQPRASRSAPRRGTGLSADEVRYYAYQAGFRGAALDTAVAIALAESGGRAGAHNPDAGTGDDSYGLWQINMLGGMGPERRRRYGLSSNEDLWDPATNARVAFALSNGGKNFNPWTTYTSGRYQRYSGQTGSGGGAPAGRMGAGGGVTAADYAKVSSTPMADTKKMTEAQLLAYVKQNYGYEAGFLVIPEVRKVLLDAARNYPNDPNRLRGALFATKWWKTTKEVTRQWIGLASTDPAEARYRLGQTAQQVRALAKQYGVTLSDQDVAVLAQKVNKYGWTPQMVQNSVASHFDYNPDKPDAGTGGAAVTVDGLRQQAAAYMVPLSEATIEKWTRTLLSGQVPAEAFTSYLRAQAKSLFPGLADAIDRGLTVENYVNPYREAIAKTLEVNPDTINLNDPRWRRVIDQKDPKTGQSVAMSLADTMEYARRQPEFANTRQAGSQAADFSLFLVNAFERGTGL